jgi:hypothetical protein
MDSTALRSILVKVDGSAPAIHQAAGAMMRFYDKGAGVAVSEWRNALQGCRPDQLLSLLYVANEVLQNSKRNRGTKFLEAFSPVLGGSLVWMVQRDPTILEKVRRTAKIWGERRVLSVRFVNDLLLGLEPFRDGGAQDDDSPAAAAFSPQAELPTETPPPEKESPSPGLANEEVSEDVVMALTSTTQDSDDDDDDDDHLNFGDSLGHLDVSLNIQSSAFLHSPGKKKRRLSSSMTGGSKRRKIILSTSSLMELWNQVATLHEGLESSRALVRDISAPPATQVDQLVGDELLDEYKRVLKSTRIIQQQKQSLHKIARDRRALEKEAVKYISWLQSSLENDEEDVKFCRDLQRSITSVNHVHGAALKRRNVERKLEEEKRKLHEEALLQKQEDEERRKFAESAMKKEVEAKPGMVWSRDRQEYVYLNTEESWRD